jgi:hypothetical protein
MKSALQHEEEEADAKGEPGKKKELSPEEKAAKAEVDRKNSERRAAARAERGAPCSPLRCEVRERGTRTVNALEKALLHKLAIYTEQDAHPDVDRSGARALQ